MIETVSGWALSPAYDLLTVSIVFPEDAEELALAEVGKKSKLKREDFEQLGGGLGLTAKQIRTAFNRFVKNKLKAMDWVEQLFLSGEMKIAYKNVLEGRYKQLELGEK